MDPEPESPASHHDFAGPSDAVLACNCCRRRKLRCSRETPACQQCRRTGGDCVYETKRAKPGMKSGAIDNLHRRLDALERALAQKTTHEPDRDSSAPTTSTVPLQEADHERTAYGILSFFAKELQRFNEGQPHLRNPLFRPDRDGNGDIRSDHHRAKRCRPNEDFDSEQSGRFPATPLSPWIASERHREAILETYFTHVHPWIPMIHEGRLRRRLSEKPEDHGLRIIVQAMELATARFIDDKALQDFAASDRDELQARDWVVCNATQQLSVENLQALIILSFNDIGSGFVSRVWAIVGSLTRMVEYLQLSSEHEDTDKQSLSTPYASVSPAKDWTEAEERRRVFWNVFSLDRFCSVSMGWNTSLTSDDVSRRLPCDGIAWRKEDGVTTPYFGIWDKAAGRIGNPIAFIPSHYAPHAQTTEDETHTPSESGISPAALPAPTDMSTVGAFAYSIEAMESLSRITTYFLQQKVNMRDQGDLSSWLTRFKELDLRLVHWKMLLPHKWKVNMARQSCRMDPNLTLAHLTHNASMILLHQLIAFPPLSWPFRNRLPSTCSVDTCQTAAVEIATIAQNFLRNAPPYLPVHSQFAFCLYVASRVLLVQWRYTLRRTLEPEFWSLVRSLDSMAERWAGPHASIPHRVSLAAKYSQKLLELQRRCAKDESFHIDVLGYTTEINHETPSPSTTSPGPKTTGESSQQDMPPLTSVDGQPDEATRPIAVDDSSQIIIPAARTDEMALQNHFQVQPIPVNFTGSPDSLIAGHGGYARGSVASGGGGELNAISQMLLGQQFMDMDRVISYDEGVFGTGYEGGGW